MDESKKTAIEEKNKIYRAAVTSASEKLNDLEKKGVQFKRVRDKTLEDEGRIQDDMQMMFARDFIEKANSVKETNPKEYYELIKKARDILNPKTAKQDKQQLIAELDAIIGGEKQAKAQKEALEAVKAKFRNKLKDFDKMVEEKKFDEVERRYTEVLSRTDLGPEERRIFEEKMKELFKAKFNDKLAAADKLAEENKIEEARNAYGEARALATAHSLSDEVDAVEKKVAELKKKEDVEKVEDDLVKWMDEDVFLSPKRVKDAWTLCMAEGSTKDELNRKSHELEAAIADTEKSMSDFTETVKHDAAKCARVKDELLKRIAARKAALSELREGHKDGFMIVIREAMPNTESEKELFFYIKLEEVIASLESFVNKIGGA